MHQLLQMHTSRLGVFRAGNEPNYSGLARAQLEKSSAWAQLVS